MFVLQEAARMGPRHISSIGMLAMGIGLASAVVTAAGQAQTAASRTPATPKKWVVERTPDGHPDFHGVWANNTVTPLQRPKQWEGKKLLTDAEVAELKRSAA